MSIAFSLKRLKWRYVHVGRIQNCTSPPTFIMCHVLSVATIKSEIGLNFCTVVLRSTILWQPLQRSRSCYIILGRISFCSCPQTTISLTCLVLRQSYSVPTLKRPIRAVLFCPSPVCGKLCWLQAPLSYVLSSPTNGSGFDIFLADSKKEEQEYSSPIYKVPFQPTPQMLIVLCDKCYSAFFVKSYIIVIQRVDFRIH
jgi:hypothetical protein